MKSLKYITSILLLSAFVYSAHAYIYCIKLRTQHASPSGGAEIFGECVNEPNCNDGCYIAANYASCGVRYTAADGKDVHMWTQKKDSSGQWNWVENVWYYNVQSPVALSVSNDSCNNYFQAMRAFINVHNAGVYTNTVGSNWIMLDNCPP